MIRRRRKLPNDIPNHDRWLVSYADFVTLLFAFFVVMYSISAVNEEKYKAFSASLETAFIEKNRQLKEIVAVQAAAQANAVIPASEPNPILEATATGFDLANERKQLALVSDLLAESLGPLVDKNLVSIKKKDYWIELELNSELLFLSGDAELASSAKPLLQKIAKEFKSLPNAINIEGHTDTNPINTPEFPSNWELSSARATRVVQEFIKEGIDPVRLSAIGYGQYHPVADNETEKGRFKNRRVVVLLISQGFSRYGANGQENAHPLQKQPVSAETSSAT
ncbi:MAG: flagellar motor protein MotD [Methylosarcina sp.]